MRRFDIKNTTSKYQTIALALLIVSPLFILLFYILLPQVRNDWTRAFYPVSKIPFTPYQNQFFINPPWLALLLSPFGFFSVDIARSLNAFFALFFLTLLVYRFNGNSWSALLTITSMPFISLLGNGSIDWVVAMAIVFASVWTVPFVLAKPQTGFLVAFVWFLRSQNKKRFILVSVFFLVISFLIWGLWPVEMYRNIAGRPLAAVNASLFPWSIPIGVLLLYYTWKNNDELAAVGASLCFTPYFVYHSLIVGFAMLSARYPKIAFAVWLLLWAIWLNR